jgi:hypothetical protein
MEFPAFKFLVEKIEHHDVFFNRSNNKQRPVYQQAAICLERLGKYGNASSLLVLPANGVGEGTVVLYFNRVIKAILSLKDEFIKWPGALERIQIALAFKEESGFENCIGCIDGTSILFDKKPTKNGQIYFSRKKSYFYNLPLVVDHRKLIRFYKIGYCGSVHDSTIYKDLEIYKYSNSFFSGEEYLLGDGGYPLNNRLVTPFRNPSNNSDQSWFNERHSATRVRVEHANGMIKERFQILKGIRSPLRTDNDFRYVNNIVECTVTIHVVCY